MKIDQYCQPQRCKHVELEQFWHAFASRHAGLSATAGLSCINDDNNNENMICKIAYYNLISNIILCSVLCSTCWNDFQFLTLFTLLNVVFHRKIKYPSMWSIRQILKRTLIVYDVTSRDENDSKNIVNVKTVKTYQGIHALPVRRSFGASAAPVLRVRTVLGRCEHRRELHRTVYQHMRIWASSTLHMRSPSRHSPPYQTVCLATDTRTAML